MRREGPIRLQPPRRGSGPALAARRVSDTAVQASPAAPLPDVAPSDVGPLRVAFLIAGLGPGGAERQLLLLTSRLHARGWPVLVVSLGAGTELEEAFRARGVEVVVPTGRPGRVPGPLTLLRAARLLRRWRPDVVQGFMFHASLLARLFRLAVPRALNVTSIRTSGEHAGPRAWLYRLTDPLCDMVTHVSPAEARDFVARGVTRPRKAVWIPNGLEAGPAPTRVPGDGRPFRWVAVGRLEEAKDYPLLLDAFARVVAEVPAELWIAGEGSLRPELEGRIARLGLEGRVHLRGHVAPGEVLGGADGYVLSSRREGMPNALLEAAGAALPVVATAVGAVPDMMARLGNGRVVPSGDAAALAGAMIEVTRMDPAERERLGARGREAVVQGFAMDQVTDQWCALYHATRASRGGAAAGVSVSAGSLPAA